jgi:outer membrane protein OmpA-like peptidoglycan-associated protein
MKNISKLFILAIAIFSLTAHSETIKEKADKGLFDHNLNIDQALAIVGDLSESQYSARTRDNAIRVLLGDNATTKSYIKTPLSVEDTLALLKGVYHRANLIAHLTSNNQIKTPLSVEQTLQLIKGVRNRGWIITDLANKGLTPNSLTSGQVSSLLGTQNDTWTVKAIKALTSKELVQNNLSSKDTLAIISSLTESQYSDKNRDNAIRVLLGDNATTKSYIKTPLSVEDTLALLKGVYHRINLIQYIADYDLIQSGIRKDSVIKLTDSNDKKFTNKVIKILSGENLIKKNYFDQIITISPEEIEKKAIQKEFDAVIRTLQGNNNLVVYLIRNNLINSEMTAHQISGLLASQSSAHRLTTFTDIVNNGLLVANLNRSDVDILIAAILGVNCDSATQQSKEQITNTVIRLLEGNNSLSKVFFKSQTKDEVAEQEKIKAEVIEIIKVIQKVHFVDFDIVFEGNHWALKQSAKRELDKLGAVLTSDVLVEGKFELVGHVSGKGGSGKVCIDSEHKYTKDSTQAKECFKSQNEWSTVLSDRRANTVKEYLIKNYSISTERLKSYGVGHSQHKFDDPDNPGNRRVEVRYIKN